MYMHCAHTKYYMSLQIYLGQEDLEQFYAFGLNTVKKLSELMPKGTVHVYSCTCIHAYKHTYTRIHVLY